MTNLSNLELHKKLVTREQNLDHVFIKQYVRIKRGGGGGKGLVEV